MEMYQLKNVEEEANKRILFHFPVYKKFTIYSNNCNWSFKYLSFSPAFT
jgi:hypothetical protein